MNLPIKYKGAGWKECNAKIKARELNVFSPPL